MTQKNEYVLVDPTTQAIVAAQFEHENINRLLQDPVDAPQTTRRRLSRQTGVDDAGPTME